MGSSRLMSVALKISGLSKRFAGNAALENVSLTVEAGEVRALVGENGAGKSTLVKVLGGYHSPDAGEVQVWDAPLALPVTRPVEHGFAIVHQELGLNDELSVW